jgi:catechol 2,3-dioxygenase-like lactoylglutathione lyase family enzyme
MRVTGINANLPVADIAAARAFYTDYLGLSVEEFNLGWVARYRSPTGEASVQLVTRDATAPHDSVISVHVGSGVDEAYSEAQRRGYGIVHPLTEEAWGVRRFFVRDPDGNLTAPTTGEWPGGSHPPALPEPGVRVSPHRAHATYTPGITRATHRPLPG